MGNIITTMERGMQRRTELLLGVDNLNKIHQTKVLTFGLGGGGKCPDEMLRQELLSVVYLQSSSRTYNKLLLTCGGDL